MTEQWCDPFVPFNKNKWISPLVTLVTNVLKNIFYVLTKGGLKEERIFIFGEL